MFYKEKIHKRFNDFDAEGNLLPWVLLEYFENTANGQYKLAEKDIHDNLVWVVTEWRIEIDKYPTKDDELFATTWAVDDGARLQTKRGFLLTDANDNVLARGCGYYILFNLETQMIARIGEDRMAGYQAEAKKAFEEELPRQRSMDGFDIEKPIIVRRSDIDGNQHVHNTKYLELGLETYEGSYRDIGFIRVTYRAQIKYDDSVVLQTKANGNEMNSGLLVDGKIHTFITIQKK